jgi:hypothetical protein
MATVRRLRGSNDLSAIAYYSTGALPSAGDTLVFDDGADSLTSGMSALSAINLAAVKFEQSFGDGTNTVGTAGAPLTMILDSAGARKLQFASRAGSLVLAAATAATKIDILELFPANAACRISLATATYETRLLVDTGVVSISDTVTVAGTLIVMGGSVVLEKHASNVPAIEVYGGTLELRRDFSSLKVAGGVVSMTLESGVTGGTVALDGGRFRHLAGDLGAVTAKGGIFDAGELNRDATIASMARYSASTYVAPKGAARVAFTAGPTDFGRGPRLG